MAKRDTIKWLSQPEDHDYPAAESYLRLLYADRAAAASVRRLRRAPIARFKAKDIFRASGLSLLGVSNSHVMKDQAGIRSGDCNSAPARQDGQPRQGHHCGRIPSTVRGVFVRRGRGRSLQDRLITGQFQKGLQLRPDHVDDCPSSVFVGMCAIALHQRRIALQLHPH